MKSISIILVFLLLQSLFAGCGNDYFHEIHEDSLSPEPLLQNLQLSNGTLSPVFSPRTTEYTLSVDEDVATVTAKISLDDGMLKAKEKGDVTLLLNEMPIEPDVDSSPIAMDIWNKDANIIIITVVSRKRKRIYRITADLIPLANESFRDITEMIDDGTGDQTDVTFAGKYRDDLTNHPGCVKRSSYDANTGLFTALYGLNEATIPDGNEADIPGYPCAAKEYIVNEDVSKPIVVLVHGVINSPNLWEEFYLSSGADGTGASGSLSSTLSGINFVVDSNYRKMLASKLVKQGYRTIAIDFRPEMIMTLTGFNTSPYAGKDYSNSGIIFDHGWTVPILQSLVRALITNNPKRKISIIGHSLGATVVRDALRRLFIEYIDNKSGAVNPWPQLQDVILLNGVHHGILHYNKNICNENFSMGGKLYCQFGDRDTYVPTAFMKALNGTRDKWTTPCGDSQLAFGLQGYCGDNKIQYAAFAMKDNDDIGLISDEVASEHSSSMVSPYCSNVVLDINSYDSSGYLAGGTYANHFSGPRSDEGMQKILELLAD